MRKQHRAMLLPFVTQADYTTRVRGIAPANLIAYWPLAEASGTTIVDESGNGRNGAYKGTDEPLLAQTGIGDGRTAPLFDGTNDYGNIYSASLNSAFNNGELTIAAWLRVSAAGVWTDGTNDCALHIGANASTNFMRFLKTTTNNQFQISYVAGGTSKSITKSSFSPTAWFHAAMTVSVSADQMKLYLNGAQEGATQTGLGVWSGALATTLCVVGGQTTTPALPWNGYLAHVAVWTTPLTAAQILSLATL